MMFSEFPGFVQRNFVEDYSALLSIKTDREAADGKRMHHTLGHIDPHQN